MKPNPIIGQLTNGSYFIAAVTQIGEETIIIGATEKLFQEGKHIILKGNGNINQGIEMLINDLLQLETNEDNTAEAQTDHQTTLAE